MGLNYNNALQSHIAKSKFGDTKEIDASEPPKGRLHAILTERANPSDESLKSQAQTGQSKEGDKSKTMPMCAGALDRSRLVNTDIEITRPGTELTDKHIFEEEGLTYAPCVMFSMSRCGWCDRAKELIEKFGKQCKRVNLDSINEGRFLAHELHVRQFSFYVLSILHSFPF